MKAIAILDAKGTVERFASVANNKKLVPGELLVAEEKPDVPDGMELVGPDYRIESDRVVAVYRAEPVDELDPRHMLARIKALEAKR